MRRSVLLLILALASPWAAAQTAPRVAWPAGPASVAGAVRAEAVALDLPRLVAAAQAREDVALVLLGETFVVAPERVTRRGAGRYTWFGPIAGGGRAVLTVEGAHVVGRVVTPRGTVVIEPRGGRHVAFVPDEAGESPDDWREPPGRRSQPPARTGARSGGDTDALFPDELHVALFYTGAVADSLGPALPAVLQATVDALTDVLANSNVPATARLVVAREVDYAESGTMSNDLYAFQDPFDDEMDEVHGVRDAYSADFAALLTETGSNSATGCGIAFLMTVLSVDFESAAFSVTKRSCGGLTFAHEIGHNLGLHHDRYVTGGQGTFPFAYGYTNTDSLDAEAGRPGFRTVLAYNTACQDLGGTCVRIPYYSNPDSLWNGQPMGLAASEDNALAAREAIPYATAWRIADEQASIGGTTIGAPTFDRPVCADPLDLTACEIAPTASAFHATSLRTFSEGLYYVQGRPAFDGVLLLYAGPFDPTAPLVRLVGYAEADALAPEPRRWLLRQPLVAGTVYTLVTTGHGASDAGAFGHSVYGPGTVSVQPVTGEGAPAVGAAFTLSAPQPNPAVGRARVTLSVAEAQAVEAVLVDALGRRVATLFQGPVEAGGTRTLEVAGVAPGVYAVEVRGARAVAVRRVTILGGAR